MKFNPHDYQKHAAKFIIEHPRAALFLDMGLGKTVITLTALDDLLYDYFDAGKALIIAPLRVARDTWPTEIEKWDHTRGLSYAVAVGTADERLQALRKNADITIINRENIDWLVNKSHYPWDFDTVIIDELSSFKSHQSKRFKALRKKLPKIDRIVGLTGTPSPNGLIDLWAQYRLIDGGERLGKCIGRYRDNFFEPDKRNQERVFSYKPRAGAEKHIYRAIEDITLSMQTSDHLVLPPLTITQTDVKMSAAELEKYNRLEAEMVLELEGEEAITAVSAAALAGKLCQLASGAIYKNEDHEYSEIHDRKLDALEDVIEAANGKPVLVAYWFKHDLERLMKRFPKAKRIDSSKAIKAWNSGEIEIGLIHPASAGHGLNLQAGGSHLVWFSLTWSLELYQQTNARLYRQGQKNPVVIQHLVTKGTLDERVMKALATKDATQTALITAVKAQLTQGENK